MLLVKFHLNRPQSPLFSVLMAPKNKGVQSTSVFPPPKPGPAQPRAHFGSQCSQRPQARVNQVSPPAFIVAELLNTDGDLDPAAQKLHFFFFFSTVLSIYLGWEISSSAAGTCLCPNAAPGELGQLKAKPRSLVTDLLEERGHPRAFLEPRGWVWVHPYGV